MVAFRPWGGTGQKVDGKPVAWAELMTVPVRPLRDAMDRPTTDVRVNTYRVWELKSDGESRWGDPDPETGVRPRIFPDRVPRIGWSGDIYGMAAPLVTPPDDGETDPDDEFSFYYGPVI
jgi:hypothetical protein